MPDTKKQSERTRASRRDLEKAATILEVLELRETFRRCGEKLKALQAEFGKRASWLKTAIDDAADAADSLEDIVADLKRSRRRRERREDLKRIVKRAAEGMEEFDGVEAAAEDQGGAE